MKGFIVAAPQSGSGKTTLTLGILRALKNRGLTVAPAKAGPDFIDPAFHQAASGQTCVNLDPWAMRDELIAGLADVQFARGPLIVEAMMGLFDGAANGDGSAADLAQLLGLPVILVVDCARQSHSVAALVSGFRDFREGLVMAGVILNNVGTERHAAMMHEGMAAIGIPVLGTVMRSSDLNRPSRHLGLVQAAEHPDLDIFFNVAADQIEASVDLDALLVLERFVPKSAGTTTSLSPPGQKVSIARDRAFSFIYEHQLMSWRDLGAELSFFSPLANEGPASDADAVFLPGGYPELHAGALAANATFMQGLVLAREQGAYIYGECGGYMVLGEGLIDAEGKRHTMANLLPLTTSFENRKLTLGYRMAKPLIKLPFSGEKRARYTAHEFHYSTVQAEGDAHRLFEVTDARGEALGACGLRRENVMGSYMHLIDLVSNGESCR